jgi:palmitoyltransferase
MIFLVLNYVACLPVILAVGVFSVYHLWAVLTNTTTIEGWEKEKARELRRKGRIQSVHSIRFFFSMRAFCCLQLWAGIG